MPKSADNYRAAFRNRHAKVRNEIRRANTAGAAALDALANPSAPSKEPLGNREARRRLRQKLRLELRKLETEE